MLLIETGLVLLALLLALIHPQLGSRWFESVERRLSQLSRRRALSVALVGLTALLLRAAVLPIEPIPEPIVHDEFGYLLAADTFAHGRLTNPTHPMWIHFESFSILQNPTYQCFAHPAQGMVLALGKVVFGHPFWGVWLSVGVMCAAITWMLQGWLPPEWALLGGVLVILRYGTFSYWANSYWGGALGAIGGALVLGALPRIKQSQRIRDALLMGLGLVILANSRPYEGLVFSVPVAILLFAWMLGKRGPRLAISISRVVLPLTLVLMLTAASLGYYFWRVTGSPFRLPYQVEQKTYAVVPSILWQSMPSAQPNHLYYSEAMKQLYTDGEVRLFKVSRTPIGFLYVLGKKIILFWTFFIGPALSFPLLMLFFVLPYGFSWGDLSSITKFFVIALGIVAIALAADMYFEPHYAAPLTSLTLGLLLIAMQRLRLWRSLGHSTGLFL